MLSRTSGGHSCNMVNLSHYGSEHRISNIPQPMGCITMPKLSPLSGKPSFALVILDQHLHPANHLQERLHSTICNGLPNSTWCTTRSLLHDIVATLDLDVVLAQPTCKNKRCITNSNNQICEQCKVAKLWTQLHTQTYFQHKKAIWPPCTTDKNLHRPP